MHRPAAGRMLLILSAAAFAAAVLVTAGPMTVAPVTRGATHEVQIANYAFAPEDLTITVGDTVTWTNEDSVMHTATSLDGAFDSGMLDFGQSFSWTFTQVGTYDYLCTPHPMMTGRITVVAPPATPTPTAAPTSAATPGAGASNAIATPAPSSSSGSLPNAAADGPSSSPLLAAGVLLLLAAAVLTAVRSTRRSRRGE